MSYPIQKIVAATIAGLMRGQHSCIELRYKTCNILCEMYGDTPITSYLTETVVEEYSVFSNANPHHGGFNGLYKTTADHYSQELFNYRLEMLYYFWMANQEM